MNDSEFVWLNEESEKFLRANESYLKSGETLSERVEQIANRAFREIYPNEEYREIFLEHMKKGHISLSTPVWANYGRKGLLSISCFGSMVEDTLDNILYTAAEVGMMSKYGGGTSAYIGKIRPRGSAISKGGTSDGSVHFAKIFNTVIDTCKQSSVRRGAMAVYTNIEHGDIKEFLRIKHEGSEIQNLYNGVCVGDKWLQDMIEGDDQKREIWAKVLQSRQRVGTPFIFFKDNVNNNKPQIYKDRELEIYSSNLC